jgi:hypothetical protein
MTTMFAATVLLLGSLLSPALSAATTSANDHRVVLNQRIGPYTNYLQGRYKTAVAVFGRPSSSGSSLGSNLCTVRWRSLGLDMRFITTRASCARSGLAGWYGATIHVRQWLVGRGIRIGDTISSMRRLYPRATFSDTPPSEPTWTLASVDREELGPLATLTATVWNGRITSIQLHYPGIY